MQQYENRCQGDFCRSTAIKVNLFLNDNLAMRDSLNDSCMSRPVERRQKQHIITNSKHTEGHSNIFRVTSSKNSN